MNHSQPDDRFKLRVESDATSEFLNETLASIPGDDDTVERLSQQLGNYQIIAEIARGGMGVVYRARQVNADRVVALKLIRGSDPGAQELERFEAEARAAAKLDHPNIVPIYDVGVIAGEPFFTMKLIEGPSLSEKLDGKPIDSRLAARIVRDTTSGIAHAHQNEIIHRDLKPGNVLLDAGDTPLVTDFGLAKLSGKESDLTRTGEAIGTPAYMPPEQASGDRDKIDHRSDVYSLGAVLYACLTGRPPFQASSSMATVIAVMKDEPVSPKLLNADVPRDLETICLKCLEKDSDARYQSALSLHDDLQRFLSNEPILARPVSWVERTTKWMRRHPARASAIAIGFVALLATIIAVTGHRYNTRLVDSLAETKRAQSVAEQQRRETAEALQQSKTAEAKTAEALEVTRKLQAELQQVTYCQKIASARMAWDEGNVRDYLQSLLSTDPQQRGWEFQYLESLGKPDATIITPDGTISLAVSSDGGKLAISGQTNTSVTLFDLDRQKVESTCKLGPNAKVHVAFSDTLKRVVCLRQTSDPMHVAFEWWDTSQTSRIKQVELPSALAESGFVPVSSSTGRYVIARPFIQSSSVPLGILIGDFETEAYLSLRDDAEILIGANFSRDEKCCMVATLDQDTGRNRILTYQLPEWNVIEEVELAISHKYRFEVSHDFQTRLFLTKDQVFIRVDADSNEAVAESEPTGCGVYQVVFHPSGEYLAATLTDGRILELSTKHLNQVADYRGMTLAANAVAYTPDGESLWAGGRDDRVMRWDRQRASQPQSFDTRHQIISLATSDDNNLVYLAYPGGGKRQGRLVCRDIETGRALWEQEVGDIMWVGTRPGTDEVVTLRWHNRRLQAWDRETGNPLWEILGEHTGGVGNACFSTDGKFCYSASSNKTIGVWDLEQRDYVASLAGGKEQGQYRSCAISSDQKRLFIAGWKPDQTAQLSVLQLSHGNEDHGSITGEVPLAHPISAITHHPTEPWLAIGDVDGQVMLYDSQTLDLIWSNHPHTDIVNALAFTPDGKRMVSASRSLALWEPRSGNQIFKLRGHRAVVRQVIFTTDGQRIVSGDQDGVLKIWGEPQGQ